MPKHQKTTEFGFKAFQLCRGRGIEVGALSSPFDLDAEVEYADTMVTEELGALVKTSPYYDKNSLVNVTHVLKAPLFGFHEVEPNTKDFVISSHVMEHHPNPGYFISECIRVVKPNGHVYVVIPNKHKTFDRRRQTTSAEYLMKRYDEFDFSYTHFRATEINVSSVEESFSHANATLAVNKIMEEGGKNYHLFTFTPSSILAFLMKIAPLLDAQIVYFNCFDIHIHFCLAKCA